jgi:O-antigen/teichoic acid export membrane protein
LGVAAYGVVGLALAIQSIASLFDFGISATVHRELARRSAVPTLWAQSVTIARRLERIYWLFAASVGIALVAVSPWIAEHWLNVDNPSMLGAPLAFAGLGVAASLPIGFYTAGLTALQRQILVNALYVAGSVLKFGGGIITAVLTDGSLVYFFMWTCFASVVSVAAHAIALRFCLPRVSPAPLNDEDNRTMWRFTFGASAVSIGLLLMSQVDKVLISRLVHVEQFAYYSLAGTVVGGLYLLYQPVVSTFAPKLTQAYGIDDRARVSALYHASNQILSATVFPAAVVVALFANDILQVWTQNISVATNAAPLVAALMPGALAGAAVYMPFTLLRAAGWTAMPAKVLVATLFVMVPALSVGVLLWGPIGGAVIWSAFVAAQSLLVAVLLHRRILSSEFGHWLFVDVGAPLAASLLMGVVVRLLLPTSVSMAATTQHVALAAAATFAAAVLSTETTRLYACVTVQRIRAAMREVSVGSMRRG